jgi:hypothetical protein
MGHGKAPNGECGMLYAAKYIFEKTGRPDKAREFEKQFREFAGTAKCKELINRAIIDHGKILTKQTIIL